MRHVQRRWPKRLLATLAILALMAGTAWAVLSIIKTTATETVTARSIGDVNIGNSETVGLFSASLTNIEPGFTRTECTSALLINPQTGDIARTWFNGAGGDLADDLTVTVRVRTQNIAAAGNGGDCPGDSNYTVAYTGTLAGLLADHGTYATGLAWPNFNNVQYKITLTLPGTVDANTVAGDTAAFAGNFENRGGS